MSGKWVPLALPDNKGIWVTGGIYVPDPKPEPKPATNRKRAGDSFDDVLDADIGGLE